MTTSGLCKKSPWLGLAATLFALTPIPSIAQISQAASAQPGPTALHIVILDGEGALNNIRERNAREPIIQVEDENHKPVSEAAVVFLIHGGDGGAGATFGGQSLSFATKTGPDGKAQAHGLQVGKSPGSFTITVSAVVGVITTETIIHQSNVITALNAKAGSHATGHAGSPVHSGIFGLHKTTTLLIAAGAVAVATVGIVVANGGSATTVSTGPGTVGPPAAKPVR